ncbi:MAG: protein kinase [Gemmataceae bacterium]|nr:protein kinase [Gemmataceae bacterium]
MDLGPASTLMPPEVAGATDSNATLARDRLTGRGPSNQRYRVAGEIARGGMGKVVRAVDCDLRREVAVKYMLDQTDAEQQSRFVEEAQITGQLEHPNIVPVHELGVDAQKRLFFAMRMVKGRSLAGVLDALRNNPAVAEKEYSLGRLLGVFVNVCHALAYAHSRGIVHRDLKPANVMLGDFGEVYVMDWGLAKVLSSAASPELSSESVAVSLSGKVPLSRPLQTDRAGSGERTMDGVVMGTVAYMPPEQAAGRISAIDQRSDVYSLGAILYVLLTLQAPIDTTGGVTEMLARVTNGRVVPPERRAPDRARAGKIPKELAAVALKALALRPEDRYATVEALRRDVELYQEGRAVSAKEDTTWETVVKLVKRNKGASAATAAALVVLAGVVSIAFNINLEAKREAERAQRTAEKNYADYREEQQAKQKQGKDSVPAFLGTARLLMKNKDFPGARKQVQVALSFDPDTAEARLLQAQLLLADRQFSAARTELEKYVQLRPQDKDAARLAELCGPGHAEDQARIKELIEVLTRQNVLPIAEALAQSREQLLAIYRKRVDDAWRGQGKQLSQDAEGMLQLDLLGHLKITDLGPLKGLPLNRLYLSGPSLSDLTPLQDMPLDALLLNNCSQLKDLAPLRSLKLSSLIVTGSRQLKDLSPLKDLPLRELTLDDCGQVEDLTPLKGLKLTKLVLSDCSRVRDLSALRGMPLTELNLGGTAVADLSPLQGMHLARLDLFFSGVRDLSPLQGMPLTYLNVRRARQVKDLGPLQGMALIYLDVAECPDVTDLSPLTGMPLEKLRFTPRRGMRGMDGLRDLKGLKEINGVPPDAFWKKQGADGAAK